MVANRGNRRLVLEDGCFVDLPGIPGCEWLTSDGCVVRRLREAEDATRVHPGRAVLLQGTLLYREATHAIVSCGGLLARIPYASTGDEEEPRDKQQPPMIRLLLHNRC